MVLDILEPTMKRSCDYDLGCYELALNGKLYHDSSLINYGYMLIENFTPTLMTISTNQNPIKSGTYVLGKRNISQYLFQIMQCQVSMFLC